MKSKKKFGNFIDNGKGYRIVTPFTPRQFTNVITNDEGYLAELSQWGTGPAFYQFSDGEINTIVDQDKKTLYLRDEETGKVWCPGVYPMMSGVKDFSCEHHDMYTKVSSKCMGIQVEWRNFIPIKGSHEIWTVNLKNEGTTKRRISVIPAVRLLLTGFSSPRFFDEQVQYSVCDFNAELNGLYFAAGNPNPRNKRYNAVLAASHKIKSFCGEGEKFLGAPLAFQYPEILLSANDLGNYKGLAGEPFQAIQCEVELEPSESRKIDFLFGIVESFDEALKLVEQIRTREDVEEMFEKNNRIAMEKRNRLIIDTPNEKLNYFVNLWLKKGLEYGLGKKDATRDNLQFADGLCMSDPARVRTELLRAFTWQYSDGHTLRSWVPLDTVYYSDGPLWFILTTCGYIKISNDLDFLKVTIPYYDHGEGTVLEHLERCMERIDTDRGKRSLPLIRFAEWNDALNLTDPNAESVFMAMAFGFMLKEMAALMRYIGDNEKAFEYENKHAEIKKIVNDVAWDEKGQYYVCAFSNDEVIGGSESEGSKIFVNCQSWAILGDMVTDERLPLILKVIDEKIEGDLGCPVNLPPYMQYDKKYGRISAQLPGTWENASSYCHVTSFKTSADVKIVRGF